MFASLKEQPADKILALMQQFKDDPRDQKIDLGVGVYKDAHGHTTMIENGNGKKRGLSNQCMKRKASVGVHCLRERKHHRRQ